MAEASDRDKASKPTVDEAEFGSILVDDRKLTHDIYVRLDGTVKKRRKSLSKAVYGTSHIVSLAEAEKLYQKGASRLIVGAGYSGMLRLSDEAAEYFDQRRCKVDIRPTPDATHLWNSSREPAIALFHVTC